MRNPLTETPHWRYTTALSELEREKAGLPVYEPETDPYVEMLKRVLPYRHGDRTFVDPAKRAANKNVRITEFVLRIYEDKSVGGLRDIMEAALLCRDVDADFFSEHVSESLDPKAIMMYRSMFYDIDKNISKQFWVQNNLFVPNHELRNDEKMNTAYMWKVVAYHGGVDRFVEYAIEGKAMEDELRDYLRRLGVSRYVQQVLKSSHSYAKLLDSAGTPVMPALGAWYKDEQSLDDGEPIDVQSDVGDAISESIVGLVQDRCQEREELRGSKFSNEE